MQAALNSDSQSLRLSEQAMLIDTHQLIKPASPFGIEIVLAVLLKQTDQCFLLLV
jgi:hypothetical protein